MKSTNPHGKYDDSSDDEDTRGAAGRPIMKMSEAQILKQKNDILMEKLYQADKAAKDTKSVMDSVGSIATESAKDKKIIELAKKNRA